MDIQRSSFLLKGCLIPVVLACCLYVIWIFWNCRMTFYIPQIGLHVRMERMPFADAKMYFSKDGQFGTDYVQYKVISDVVYMNLFFVPPNTICVSGASGTKQGSLKIIEYEEVQKYHKQDVPGGYIPEYYMEYTDSTFLKNPSYKFNIFDYFSGFSVQSPKGVIIYKTGIGR